MYSLGDMSYKTGDISTPAKNKQTNKKKRQYLVVLGIEFNFFSFYWGTASLCGLSVNTKKNKELI